LLVVHQVVALIVLVMLVAVEVVQVDCLLDFLV
jgi:hypothetical protein